MRTSTCHNASLMYAHTDQNARIIYVPIVRWLEPGTRHFDVGSHHIDHGRNTSELSVQRDARGFGYVDRVGDLSTRDVNNPGDDARRRGQW
jgi:hypothetical protein